MPPPVRPPVRPPPRYNVPPKRVSLPPSPLPSPIGATLVPWMQIVGAGDDGYPSPGAPPVRPLEEGFELEGSWLHTETGATIPLSITLIQDLTLLPTTLDLGQGPIVIDWGDFSEFTSTTGRYLLLRADVRLDVLFLPEPSGAAALLTGMAAMCWAGRRARR
ncbi:MAG: hypothetical protein SF069_00195 [Phycisphaerae bacterium]|nr:hypothetical protein [Phycisphaerae bacterium]